MNNELYLQAIEIKNLYKRGIISREEAKCKIAEYADYYNTTAKRLSQKYNQKYKPFSFASFMR